MNLSDSKINLKSLENTKTESSNKWPQESDHINKELERYKQNIDNVLKNKSTETTNKTKGTVITISIILFIAVVGILIYLFVQKSIENNSPLQIAKDSVIMQDQRVANVEGKNNISGTTKEPEVVKEPTVEKEVVKAKKDTVITYTQLNTKSEKVDTIWLSEPSTTSNDEFKKLKIRLIVDPNYFGALKTYIDKDSVWLFIRVGADSSFKYKNVRAYIDYNKVIKYIFQK